MAEEAAVNQVSEATEASSPAQDMEVETLNAAADSENGDQSSKRAREEGAKSADEEENGGDSKKPKIDKSVEEQRLEKLDGTEGEKESGPVNVGPKSFGSAVEMFDYFYKFLHFWPPNVAINQYEHLVLLDLLKKGHLEPDAKIGKGIRAFQVRYHPQFKSRCFFLVRDDDSVDDFSFRKCVDHILPLPENMQVKTDVNKALGGGGGGGRGGKGGGGSGGRGGGRGGHGHGHGRGRGRGGKFRN